MAVSIISFALLSHLPFLTAFNPPDFRHSRCFDSKVHYTNTSTYQTNLHILLSRLNSNAKISNNGFVNISHGQNPDRVNVVGLCRGGVKEDECNSCLKNASILLPRLCPNQKEAMGSYAECTLRYSTCSMPEMAEPDSPLHLVSHYLFYDPTTDGSPKPSSPTSASQGKTKTLITVVTIVVPILASLVLLYVVWIFVRARMNRRRRAQNESEVDNATELAESIQCAFETIEAATDNFSNENKLGQGGFGHVYRGRLSNGQDIAVKRLSRNSGQGDIEFKNEVLLMAQLLHRNLVRLIGFCLKQNERLLIYEFLPHGSLDYFIFDPAKRSQLGWETRFKVIEGIARGLLYLHEESQQRIIHRDLKPSNILLDAEMNPKISDFGMARLFVSDQVQVNTNKVAGTLGYMAPEYARYGQFSVKSDVFSYGVLILEIISGQRNGSFHYRENVEHLLSFAWKSWMKGTVSDIVDSTLIDGSRNEIMRCIHIGLLCVQEKAACRPTMASIILMLNSNSFCLPSPLQPGFFINHRSFPEIHHGEYSFDSTSSGKQESKAVETQSANEVSMTDLYPR